MNGYFLAIIIIFVLSLGSTLAQHGKARQGKYSFWGSLISTAIILTLVYFAIKTGF